VRLVADDELVGLAAEAPDVPREPSVRLDRQRVLAERLAALLDRRREAIAVALRGEVARELRDEQAAVRQDQDAERARRLDEAGRSDRLPRRRRMAEAIAADRAGVGLVARGWEVFEHVLPGALVGLLVLLVLDDLLEVRRP